MYACIIGRSVGLSIAVLLGAAGAASAQSGPCPANGSGLNGQLRCSCSANAATAPVWGTGVYTSDSDICTAARHAGAIGSGGGEVLVTSGGRQEHYSASTQNGISTSEWGAWDSSFTVSPVVASVSTCSTMPSGVDVHDCTCPAGPYTGTAWGSDPYTNDSNICVAAMHSGIIGDQGGSVRVLAVPGLDSYRGSEWNGVTTSDYGTWGASITFDRN